MTSTSDANLLALGLSSMAIAELVGKTCQLLQINLSPSAVFRYPQVRALARHLVQSPSGQGGWSRRHRAPGAPEPATPTDILVPMQSAGARSPIVLVPGADGSVLSLKLLCEALGDQQPLYGLEAIGLDGNTPLPGSIEEIAQVNIAALRRIRPHGPYRLLGYSNGGVVAFEMARTLLDQGEHVESLMLLDSLCPAQRKGTETELVAQVFNHLVATLGATPDLDARQLEQVPGDERAEHLYRWLSGRGLALDKAYFIATYNVATASEASCAAPTAWAALTGEIDVWARCGPHEGYRERAGRLRLEPSSCPTAGSHPRHRGEPFLDHRGGRRRRGGRCDQRRGERRWPRVRLHRREPQAGPPGATAKTRSMATCAASAAPVPRPRPEPAPSTPSNALWRPK